jgi:energy-coupling factor transport system substrate-specific component
MLVAAVVGFFALLFLRRDASVAYVTVIAALTGVLAAIVSAPISANLFGGVTGAGTDFLVAFAYPAPSGLPGLRPTTG